MVEAENTKEVFTLTLRLDINDNDRRWLNKTFYYGNHLYNVCVKEARRRVNKFKEDPVVNSLFKEYFKNGEFTKEQQKILKQKRIDYNINGKYCFEQYLNKCRQKFSKYIDADSCAVISQNVYRSVDAFLFKKGKQIHFKKYKDFCSLVSKSNRQGIKYRDGNIVFQDKCFPVIIKNKDDYVYDCFCDKEGNERKIKFSRIKRKYHKHNYRYYTELVFEGVPPLKERTMGSGKVGIDIGTSTIAVVGRKKIILKELNDEINEINAELRRLNRKADRQRRANNPQNYNEDGTIKRNSKSFHRTWKISHNLKLTYDKIKELYRKRSEKLRYFQNLLSNEILTFGSEIKIETMNFQALQKRAKKTEISEKTHKYKKKKRFGKSIQIHAPVALVEKLITKARYFGNVITKIDTRAVKASQLNHITGECIKAELNERWKKLTDEIEVQRDLYSAFIIENVDDDGKTVNIEACIEDFDEFLKMHDALIKELKEQKKAGKKFPACMGI